MLGAKDPLDRSALVHLGMSLPTLTSTKTKNDAIVAGGSGGSGLKIIHAGLFRTGTKSMATAYAMLGYRAHHGLDDVFKNDWGAIERAAEGTWPHCLNVPAGGSPQGPRPHPRFTRADWDRLWGGRYDVATDLASPFVEQLIEAYPDAKVVVVQRPFEAWWPSFESECLDGLYTPIGPLRNAICWYVLGLRAPHAMRKLHAGFFHARTRGEITDRARQSYEAYYARIRALVPPEKRLEYQLGDGWEPLCAFLDVPVPNVPFPRENDRASHNKGAAERVRFVYGSAVQIVGPYIVAVVVLVLAWYWCGQRSVWGAGRA